ncbi:MAG: glycosyl hydrolase family 65 protein [Rubrobacteraceae bacterium]
MGVMAGTLDLIQRSYAGSDVRDGILYFKPKTMKQLDGLSFPMRFRGIRLELTFEGHKMTVSAQADGLGRPVKIGVGDEVRELKPGESQVFET